MAANANTLDTLALVTAIAGAALVFALVLVVLVTVLYYAARTLTEPVRRYLVFKDSDVSSRLATWGVAWQQGLGALFASALSVARRVFSLASAHPVALLLTALVFVAAIVVRETHAVAIPALAETYTCFVVPVAQSGGRAAANVARGVAALLVPLWNGLVRVTNGASFGLLSDAIACGAPQARTSALALLKVAESSLTALGAYLTSGSLVESPLELTAAGADLGLLVASFQGYVVCTCASLSLYTLPLFAAFTGSDAVAVFVAEFHEASARSLADPSSTTYAWSHEAHAYAARAPLHPEARARARARAFAAAERAPIVIDSARLVLSGAVNGGSAFALAVNASANALLGLVQGSVGRLLRGVGVLAASGFTDFSGALEAGRFNFDPALNSASRALVAAGLFIDEIVANYYELVVGIETSTLGGAYSDEALRATLPYPYGPGRPPFFGHAAGHAASAVVQAVKVAVRWLFNADRVFSTYDGLFLWRLDEVYAEVEAAVDAVCDVIEWLGAGFEAQARRLDGQNPHCPDDASKCALNSGPCTVPTNTVCTVELTSPSPHHADVCLSGACAPNGTCVPSTERFLCECVCAENAPADVCRVGGDAETCALFNLGRVMRDVCGVVRPGTRALLRLLKNGADVVVGTVYTLVEAFAEPPSCVEPVAPADRTRCSLPAPTRASLAVLNAPLRFLQFYWGDRDRCPASLCALTLDVCFPDGDGCLPDGTVCSAVYNRCLWPGSCPVDGLSDGSLCTPAPVDVGSTVCVERTCLGSACVAPGVNATFFPCACQCYGTPGAPYAEPVNEFERTLAEAVAAFDGLATLVRSVGAVLIEAERATNPLQMSLPVTSPWEALACLVSAVGRVVAEAVRLLLDALVHADYVLAAPNDVELETAPLLTEIEATARCLAELVRSIFATPERPHPHLPEFAFVDCGADALVQLVRALVSYAQAGFTFVATSWRGLIEGEPMRFASAFPLAAPSLFAAANASQAAVEDVGCLLVAFIDDMPCTSSTDTHRFAAAQPVRWLAFVFVGQPLRLVPALGLNLIAFVEALTSGNAAATRAAIESTARTVVFYWADSIISLAEHAGRWFGCVLPAVRAELDVVAGVIAGLADDLVDVIDGGIVILFELIAAIIGLLTGTLEPLFLLIERFFDKIMIQIAKIITPEVACIAQEALCIASPGGFFPGGVGAVPGWQFCYETDAVAAAVLEVSTPFITFPSVCLANGTLCFAISPIVCLATLSVTPFPGCPPCATYPGTLPPVMLRRKRDGENLTIDAATSTPRVPAPGRPRAHTLEYTQSDWRVRVLFPELRDIDVASGGDVCQHHYVSRLDERWPARHANDSALAEACFFAYAPAAYARLTGTPGAALPAVTRAGVMLDYMGLTYSIARALAASPDGARKRTAPAEVPLAAERLARALEGAHEARAARARARAEHRPHYMGVRYVRAPRTSSRAPSGPSPRVLHASRTALGEAFTRANDARRRLAARLLPAAGVAASARSLFEPRTVLAHAVRASWAANAPVAASAPTSHAAARHTLRTHALTNASTLVDARSPFACLPAQFLCANCSWLDRLLAYGQADVAAARAYYSGEYTETTDRIRESNDDIDYYLTTGEDVAGDTYATATRTPEPIFSLLADITWFWQWDWSEVRALVRPPTPAPRRDYRATQAASPHTSANVHWAQLLDELGPGTSGTVIDFAERLAADVRHVLDEPVLAGHAGLERYLVCNTSVGHYCRRDGVTPRARLLGLLSGVANVALLAATVLALAAFVPLAACPGYALLALLTLVAVPLALAISYEASPLCYTPSAILTAVFAISPGAFTALGMLPALPVCLVDDATAGFESVLPPCAPFYPASLVRAGDARAANVCSRCGVPAPDAIDCGLESSFVSGYDNILYMLEQLFPGFNERLIASPFSQGLPWLRDLAALHTSAANAADPAAAACNVVTILDVAVALVAFAFALLAVQAIIALFVQAFSGMLQQLAALAVALVEMLEQIAEGYLDVYEETPSDGGARDMYMAGGSGMSFVSTLKSE